MSEGYETVKIEQVPPVQSRLGKAEWFERLRKLPIGEAGVLQYNNKQRANQVVGSIRQWAKYHNFSCLQACERHDVLRGYLVYFWLEEYESMSAEEARKMIDSIPGYRREAHKRTKIFKVE